MHIKPKKKARKVCYYLKLSIQSLLKLSWGLLVFSCLLGGFFLYTILLSADAASIRPAKDFITFYAGSSLAQQGQAASAYALDKIATAQSQVWFISKPFPWFYPPTYFLVVYPLNWFSYVTSFVLFMLTSLGLYIFSAWRILPTKNLLLPLLAFPPVLINVMYGQNGLLTVSLALLALHDISKHPLRAGIWIGLLSIKPHLGVLFPLALIIGGHWRTFLSAATSCFLFVGLSIFCFGVLPWQEFMTNLGQAREWLESGRLATNRMISAFAVIRLAGGTIELAYAGHILIAVSFLIAFTQVWCRTQDHNLRSAAFAVTTLTISPYIFEYELIWIGIAILMLTRHAIQHGWRCGERELLCLIAILPIVDLLMHFIGVDIPFIKIWAITSNIILMLLITSKVTNQHKSKYKLTNSNIK